jgi:hypothetical protein
VAVPKDTITTGVPAVVAVSGVPLTGDIFEFIPQYDLLKLSWNCTIIVPAAGLGFTGVTLGLDGLLFPGPGVADVFINTF